MPLRSCLFVHTGGRVFFFWGSSGSIISHSLSVKSLEYPISRPKSIEFTYSALILRDRLKDLKLVLYIDRYPDLGWGQLITGGVNMTYIPGEHLSLMAEPHAAVLAEKLKLEIDRTISESHSKI
jgi:thioesterase domain-containing protein